MARNFIINGKFLRAESTGVHRVATELANAIAALIVEDHPALTGMSFSVFHTHDGLMRASTMKLSCRALGPLTGIPWEQLTLPLRKGNATLLNFCNIGPVAVRNAVTMIHDAQVHTSPQSYSRGFRLWYHLIQPILGRRNRAIITVSEFSKSQIADLGIAPAERIHVVHNGVDHVLRVASDLSPLAALELRAGRYVVALSTTQAHKNIGLLLSAFSDPVLADIPLVLIGGTGAAAFSASGIHVPANVRFAGRVSDEAMRGLIENALCLAFPSTTEGFGLPPLEAMALGCPAIVAPCGALPEICGQAALYVAPDDAKAWATAIFGLAESTARRNAQVALGIQRARQFTWRAAALKLVALLQSLP